MNQEDLKAKKPVVHARRYRRARRNGIRQHFNVQPTPLVFPTGAAAEHGQKRVVDIKMCNEKEKKAMQDLNSKLANHIEKTRMVEAENKHLKELLGKSQIEFNIDVIKIPYEEQLDDLKAILEDKDKKLAVSESQNESLEELVEDLREQMHQLEDERDRVQTELDGMNEEVARSAADAERCSRKAGELERQLADWKSRNGILADQLADLRTKLQSETTQRLASDNRITALEDELEFNNDVHDTEVKEYQRMLSRSQKIPDLKETWKAEVGNMVTDLSAEYDAQLNTITADMEARHAAEIQLLKSGIKAQRDVVDVGKPKEGRADMMGKIGEYETQVANMKSRMADLQSLLDETISGRASDVESYQTELNRTRSELELVLKELEDLVNSKLSMELEIAAYRRLLDVEESRMGTKAVVTVLGGFQTEAEAALSNALASASKMTMSRSTTGRVSVIELATDGKYIKLEDLSKFPMGATTMKNWTLTQTLENGKKYTHTFTDGNVFSSGKIVKIWGSKHGAGQDGITSPTVEEWASMVMPSTITLTDDQEKQSASTVIKINA